MGHAGKVKKKVFPELGTFVQPQLVNDAFYITKKGFADDYYL